MSALPSLPQASSPDYWQLAFDSLETKLKAKLNSTRTGKRDIPNAVLNAAEEKRNLCLRKAWRFEKPNGEVVIIREVIEKISKWVEKFKEVGDNAVQYDTAHASLPWAGVRFLLLLSFNEAKIFGTMAENLAIVSRLITCGKAYESLYLPHQAGANDQMQQCLIQFYATILEFLAKAIRFYQDSTLSRVFKSVIRNVEDPQMQRILDKESELLKLAQLKNMEALIEITSLTKSIFDRTKMTEKALEEQQYQELLRWLSIVNISAIHEDAYDHRISGTGEWFLKNHEYKQWRSSTSSSILVLHGIPGCGKTVLTAIVVEEFITERRTDPTVSPFAYFYCANSKTEWERSQPVEILRSIVKQLTLPASLYPKARSIVLSEYDRTKAQCNAEGSDMTKPRIEKCVSLILDVAMDDPLTIVIDAIDEVEVDLQHELLNALRQIVTDSNNVVRVMVTTRNQGHILKLLPGAVKVGISSQHNHHDVHQYTRILLEDKRNQGKLEISPDLEARITEVLLSEAKEMFLWIKLQVDHFCRMKTEKDIENAMIGRKFVQLNELYTDLLTAMLVAEPVARQIAVDTISWLLYAKEPLTSDALGSAIIPTNVGPVNMPEICMNLIRLDNSSSVFRFSHYSVQEFLRTQDIFAKHSANQRLAIQCLRVCVMGPSDRSYPIGSLFRYCAIYWGYHYKRAVCLDEPGKMLQHAKSFIYDEYGNQSLSFLSWLDSVKQISDAFDRDHPQKIALEAIQCPDQAPLFTASVFGLSDIFDYITSISHDKHDWDQKNLIGQTSLYLAAAFGHDTIVSSLISRGADYDIHCGRQGSPMAAACFAGHQNVVQVLLGAGASIKPCGRFSSAIESTFRGDNESLALYLLKHAYPSLDQETYDSIALSASQAGFLEVIRYLHTPGMMASLGKKSSAESQLAQITSTIRIGDVASLEWKINKSNKPPLSILPPDGLANAALYGQEKMVEFLLQIGLSVEAEGLFGSPLRAASLMNHERIVVQLLNGGAKIRAHSVLGDALQAAARKGHAKLAQFLIDEGADPNLNSGPYGNALQAAAYHGHVEVVQSLLDANADIYQEGFREDACHAAAEGGREEIVSFFIRNGYKFRDRLRGPQARKRRRSRYKQLIRNASPTYRAQSRSFRPDLGSSIQLSTEERNYAESSFEITFQAMREPGLMTKKSVIEPYRYSRLEEDDILDLLVKRPSESTSTEARHLERSELKSDFATEARGLCTETTRTGKTEVLKQRLHHGADINTPVGCHDRALANAARNGTAAVIKRLIEKGVDVIGSNSDGGLLQIVVAREISANPVLMQLLDAGAILPTTKGSINNLLDKVLSYFVGDTSREKFDTYDDPDGRFLQSQSLRDVFDEGPGAVVETLLSCLKDEKAYDERYGLVLQMAALLNRDTIVSLLLERGVNVNAKGYYYGTALQAASRCGHTNIVRLLLKAGADVNICQGRHHTALRAAVLSKNVATVELLIDAGAVVQDDIEYQVHPLITACGQGDTRLVTLLLDAGAPVNVSGRKAQYHHSVPDEDASPLNKASKVADVEMVRLLLSRGADAQKVGDHSRSALVVAARAGSRLVVRELLSAGGGTQLGTYETAVIEAASNGHLEALRELLHHVSDLTVISHAIVPACKARHFRVIEALIDSLGTFDDDSKNYILQDALEEVSKLHDAKVYDVLLEYSTTIDADYLVRACTAGSLLGIQIAISEGVPIDSEDTQGRLGLHAAAYDLESSVVQYLIQHGAKVGNINPLYGSPLVAALEGCLETPLAELERLELAQKDPQRNPRNRSRLSSSQDRRNAEELLIRSQQPMLSGESEGGTEGSRRRKKIMQRIGAWNMGPGYEEKPGPSHHQLHECEKITHSLVDAGAPCDTEFGRFGNALHLAAFLGSDTIVKLLLDRGASINACGGFFGSALCAALEGKRSSVVEILLSKGATTQCSTVAGATPLDFGHALEPIGHEGEPPLISATIRGHHNIVQVLLAEGANVNAHDRDHRKTALHWAAEHGWSTIVKSLLEQGSSFSIQDKYGETPLHYACGTGHLKIVQMLVEFGSSMEILDFVDRTPISCAQQNNHTKVTDWLTSR